MQKITITKLKKKNNISAENEQKACQRAPPWKNGKSTFSARWLKNIIKQIKISIFIGLGRQQIQNFQGDGRLEISDALGG